MLTNSKLYAVLSTTDIERAKKFYGETLGLKPKTQEGAPEDHIMFEAGNGAGLLVYLRSDPPKAENTVAGFDVANLEEEMAELRSKGVTFEEYDFPGLKTENGVASMGNMKSSWFKDPDGNIISLNQA